MAASGPRLEVLFPVFLTGACLITLKDRIGWAGPALVTLLLAGYVLVSFLWNSPGETGMVHRIKLELLAGIIGMLVILPMLLYILTTHTGNRSQLVHDSVLQSEAAIRFLLDGRNPYAETYERTPLAKWVWDRPYPNPALYYFAYLPFIFLAGLPLYALSVSTLGWYDQRFLYMMAFVVALWTFAGLATDRSARLIALAVIALNPLVLFFFIEGRNDIMLVALIGLSLWALDKRESRWRFIVSGVFFGLACATKQSAWLLGPFYLVYVWGRWTGEKGTKPARENLPAVLRGWVAPSAVAAAILILPFFLWSPASFWEDTVSYLSGNVSRNYPMKSEGMYGLSALLSAPQFVAAVDTIATGPLSFVRGIAIRDERQSYPFWIFQLLFAAPVLFLALWKQWRDNTISTALAGYAIFLLMYQYFSRFLHDNYIGYIATMLALAYLIREPMPVLGSTDEHEARPNSAEPSENAAATRAGQESRSL